MDNPRLLKDDYMTASQSAKYLSVSRQTIYRWLKENRLRGEIMGSETLIEIKLLDSMRCPTCGQVIKPK